MTEIVLFALFSLAAVFFAVNVIFRRNAVHCALHLVGVLLAMSGLFVLLNAQFIAAIQILVYAGAIMVLFLFVVMLLNAPHEETVEDERRHLLVRSGSMRLGALLAVALGVELVWALSRGTDTGPFAGGSTSSVSAIGRLLFTEYAFAFEVTSVLILVAMVGAVILAQRERA
jgi:NADH-quinone oxidoreductase subunit J